MSISLESRLALHELAHYYGDVIDDRNWSGLATIFTEDAVFEVVDLVVMRGLPEISHYMEHEGRHPLAHLITNVYVVEDDNGVRMHSRGVFPIAGDAAPGHRVFYGSYYDRLRHTNSGWRICHRLFSTLRQPEPGV